jgi:putative heme transporter
VTDEPTVGAGPGPSAGGTGPAVAPDGAAPVPGPGSGAADEQTDLRLPGQTPSVASPKSLPAFAYSAPPSRRMTILKGVIVVGFMVFVFGVLLPRYVDYAQVIASLQALTLQQFAIVTALAFIAWVLSGSVQAALLPGLGLRHSTISWLSGQGVSNVIPGPVDLAVRYILYRQWGHAPEPSSLSIVLAGVFDQLAGLSMPVVAVVVLGIEGTGAAGLKVLALIGVAVIVAIFAAGYAILRSERLAYRVGRLTERFVGWLFHLLRRPTPTGIAERALAVRLDVKDLLLSRGLLAYLADLSGRVFYGVVFIVCLRETGVPADVLTAGAILAVYAAVGILLILPIAPGGAGTPQVLYIAGLSSIAGDEWSAQVSAGVFLFFVVQWVMPTVIGWITLIVERRGRPLLSTGEKAPAPAATPSAG